LREYAAYDVNAIPKATTDHKYQMAVNMMLRHNRKKQHPTRRDFITDKIQSNIARYNDPKGLENDFDALLVGYSSKLN